MNDESRQFRYLQLRELKLIRYSLLVLAGLGLLSAMYLASDVLVPVFLAFLIYLLLAPVVDAMSRFVPRFVAALVALTLLCTPFMSMVVLLSDPASQWLKRAPASVAELQLQIKEFAAPLEPVKEASEAVDEVMKDLKGEDTSSQVVTVRAPGFAETIITASPGIIGSTLLAVALAFLLLLSGHRLIATLLSRSGRFSDRRNAYRAVARMRRDASRYLGTILVINIALGCASSVAFGLIGLPNPVLWGVVAGILNFAPYIGAAITFTVVTFVAMATFSEPAAVFAPGAVFFVITLIEGQLVTPMILGSRLAIHPASVVLAVVVFAALWGVAGALMALPLCIATRAAYRQFEVQKQAGSIAQA